MGCGGSKAAAPPPQEYKREDVSDEDKALAQLELVFKSVDVNADGRASKEELTAALNKNEKLELLIQAAGNGKSSESVLSKLQQGTSWEEFQQLLKAAATAEVKENDGALAAADAPVQERALRQLKLLFDKLDSNADGRVDAAELEKQLSQDKNENGLMKDGTLGKLMQDAELDPYFKPQSHGELDSSNDGKITFEEFKERLLKTAKQEVQRTGNMAVVEKGVFEQLKDIFMSMDADENGAVFKDELEKRLKEDKNENDLKKEGSIGKLIEDANLNPYWNALMQLDTTKDGMITWAEFEKHLRSAVSDKVTAESPLVPEAEAATAPKGSCWCG